MAKATSVPWTREHRLIALNLYYKIRFGQFHRGNPLIKDVAAKMGRTASSLAIKLCNFASLDPAIVSSGRVGMRGAANADRDIWSEFHATRSVLGVESEQLLHDLFTQDETKEVDFLARDKVRLVAPSGPTETQATVKVRRGQQFFRQAVLNAYDVRCCISGINVQRLLVASHIKPWGKFPDDRLNPRNGLCLSTLHDAVFDAGLITLDERLSVVLSKRLRSFFPNQRWNKISFHLRASQFACRENWPNPIRGFCASIAKRFFYDSNLYLFPNCALLRKDDANR